MSSGKRIRRFVLYPLLFLAGLHTLGTGSPVPLWHLERLNNPIAVHSVTESHLVLDDGRKVTLPFIKLLPHDNPLFQAALSYGVEVGTCGEVTGLMWFDRFCGNDPVVWRRQRVNLSDLAATVNPAGIDDSQVAPETIVFIQEHKSIDLSKPSRSHQNNHLSIWDQLNMQFIHEQFEFESSAKDAALPRVESSE